MNPAEIVVREVQGQGRLQVRQLLVERVGQSGKASAHHPDGRILPLDYLEGP
jgi:hypothetical protein